MAKKNEPRFCKDCGKDISDMHVQCIRCPECKKAHQREITRKWNQENKEKKESLKAKLKVPPPASAEKTQRMTPTAKRNITKALKGLDAERERAMLKPNRVKSIDDVIALADAAGVSYGHYVATHRGV